MMKNKSMIYILAQLLEYTGENQDPIFSDFASYSEFNFPRRMRNIFTIYITNIYVYVFLVECIGSGLKLCWE